MASEVSLRKLAVTLKARVKRLEAKNTDLRRQSEVTHSQVIYARDLAKQMAKITAVNERLRSQNSELEKHSTNFAYRLEELGVEMNSTLENLFEKTPESIIKNWIEALKEARKTGPVKSPRGFLYKLINDQ
ncbi:MAG: hypothetical protein ACFB14_00215 [Leptolyngbyaceae cyanobacterium]